jgi:hypothetical protein
MQLNPYLTFQHRMQAAFKFYEKCLGGKIHVLADRERSALPRRFRVPQSWRILADRLSWRCERDSGVGPFFCDNHRRALILLLG